MTRDEWSDWFNNNLDGPHRIIVDKLYELEQRAEQAEAKLRTAHATGLVTGIVELDSDEMQALRERIYRLEKIIEVAKQEGALDGYISIDRALAELDALDGKADGK